MKSWDLPIARNALVTRADLEAGLAQILEPLSSRLVRGGSGLHVGNSSAHYDERAALMEGYCRLLWGLAPLAAGGGSSPILGPAVEGLKAGTDPSGPYYWGVGGDRDQRYVEMAALSLALLVAPRTFWEPLSDSERGKLASWLATINGVELPPNNWEFFRVLVNVALRRLGRPYDPGRLEAGLEAIDSLYRDEGWYVDETNYDNYNPFGFHFYGLVYAALMREEDPARCSSFRERARRFAASYLPWFGSDGSIIPHGRSLTYRFAACSFFSACAFAGEEVLPWGAIKGIVLRNLRWWFKEPIFDHEGLLTIGYAYPNLIMAEQYNAPGSPYWALKAFLILALPPEHPFWASEEEALPRQAAVSLNAPPNILACRAGEGESEHVYALAAGQYPCYESVQAAAKYAKFAYSSRFGFCVSLGAFDLSKTGCDSMLMLTEGDGYWRERRHSRDRFSCIDFVRSSWSPWTDVEVVTWLLPVGTWHMRVHAVSSGRELDAAEGGFSLPDQNAHECAVAPRITRAEGSILAALPWASGGIVDLSPGLERRAAELHKPEPNLNLLYPKVLVPLLRGKIGKGETILACAVFAASGSSSGRDLPWDEVPAFTYDAAAGIGIAQRGSWRVELDIGAFLGARP
jgi:hypothetical protein